MPVVPVASPDTVPPTVYLFVPQSTRTSVTLFAFTLPVPFVTVHVWLGADGCDFTVTAKSAPLGTGDVKTKSPSDVIVRSFPRLFCRTSPDPVSPVTFPPTVKLSIEHAT